MCVASVVHDYYGQRWDMVPTYPLAPTPTAPYVPPLPSLEQLDLIKRLVKMAEEIDKKLDDKVCTDPLKAKWLEDLEKRVRALEAK